MPELLELTRKDLLKLATEAYDRAELAKERIGELEAQIVCLKRGRRLRAFLYCSLGAILVLLVRVLVFKHL